MMRQGWNIPGVSANFVAFIHSPVYDFMIPVSITTYLRVAERISVGKSCKICLSYIIISTSES